MEAEFLLETLTSYKPKLNCKGLMSNKIKKQNTYDCKNVNIALKKLIKYRP